VTVLPQAHGAVASRLSEIRGAECRGGCGGPGKRRRIQKVLGDEALPFIGLPDPGHTVLKLYGQEVKIFKLGRMPAQVMIDQGGMVRFVHYGHSMEDIPSNEELLALLGEMNREGDKK
jgi:peroxiredoxin Q/BCP